MKFDIRETVPVVSASLITYNHAPYIRACIDSMLGQKTDFPFEICIGEDESTDGTREICIEYAEKYPDRIRLILRSQFDPGREEFRSQGVYNYVESAKACLGRYIALCDGDDLWTDPLKLQKQFDAMEANPSVAMVHSDYDILDEISGKRIRSANKKRNVKHVVNDDLAIFKLDIIHRKYSISPCTAFMRTRDLLEIFDQSPELFKLLPMGDTTTWCELTNYGSLYYLEESTGIYRVLPESDSNSRSAEKKYKFVNQASNLGVMLAEKYGLPVDRVRASKVKNCNRYALLSGDIAEINSLYADPSYRFSFNENCVYLTNQSRLFRPVAKKIYELKYKLNSRYFNTH
ncbi:glycosyltransferase [Pontiellaceae bacterium B12227]|nr:glycosyltransferase [Pontiellaceae bacterium B12227]